MDISGSLGFQIQKYILIGLEQFFVDIFVWDSKLEMETWFSELVDVKLGKVQKPRKIQWLKNDTNTELLSVSSQKRHL